MNIQQRIEAIYRATVVVLVTLYLILVGLWLALTRRVSLAGIRKLLLASFRAPYKAELHHVRGEKGLCWLAPLPRSLISDADGLSRLVLLEDGKPLPLPHAPHEEIRRFGGGRYSHWGPQIYFSTPDNTDPRYNGRCYTVEELQE